MLKSTPAWKKYTNACAVGTDLYDGRAMPREHFITLQSIIMVISQMHHFQNLFWIDEQKRKFFT